MRLRQWAPDFISCPSTSRALPANSVLGLSAHNDLCTLDLRENLVPLLFLNKSSSFACTHCRLQELMVAHAFA